MPVSSLSEKITHILEVAESGDGSGNDQLFPLLYEELHRLAHQLMRGEGGRLTLQTTALVHEAYVRLLGGQAIRWENHAHFFGAAARAMRRILVEHARRRNSVKRGGRHMRLQFDHIDLACEDKHFELLALDEALDKLESKDKRKSEVVMLRFFAGLTVEQTAKVMGLSSTTIKDEWCFSRAWLATELGYGGETDE